MSGQSIMDRVQAARHSIAGQGLAKSVCKATTEEIIGPKKKHLDYLLQCTNEPNVSIPQLADLLIERTQHANWIVVYKSLITIHNLMNYGNERFTQYLASNNCTFNLGSFHDKAGMQGEGMVSVTGYDMSTYIRRYAKYLNEKATSYRQMAFDFCKVKRGKDDGLLRTMNSEKLLKALPVLQSQLNALIEFDCTPNELTNGVINACFMLLFKDLIRLFACYNDGIINLLEKYFDMNKKQCKEGLDIYKKFLVSMDKVSEFLKVAENVGIDRGDIPDLAKAPASLLDALEQHLLSLEGKKGSVTTTTATPKPAGFASALSTISNNSSALNVSEDEKKRILDEENQRLHQLKVEQRMKELQSTSATTPTSSPTTQSNPFTAGTATTRSVDLFGPNSPTASSTPATNGKPSDDLLSLNANPFAQNVESVMATAYGGQQQQQQPQQANNPFAVNTGWNTNNTANFGNEVDFAKAFNNTNAPAQGFDAFGEVLQPHNKPNQVDSNQKKTDSTKLLAGDLDSSLSTLAGNLHIGGPAQQVKKAEHQWQPKGEQKLTGGTNWQMTSAMASTTWNQSAIGQQPLNQPPMGQQPMGQQFQQPMMGAPPMQGGMGYAQPGMIQGQQPMMGIGQQQSPQMMGMNLGMGQQPQMYGARMQPMGFQQPRPPMPQSNNMNDPFGAL